MFADTPNMERRSSDLYFPQPTKGQSLLSFLSSQDFHTCAELDKVSLTRRHRQVHKHTDIKGIIEGWWYQQYHRSLRISAVSLS